MLSTRSWSPSVAKCVLEPSPATATWNNMLLKSTRMQDPLNATLALKHFHAIQILNSILNKLTITFNFFNLKSQADGVPKKLKPVSCKMCSRTFASHSHLKQHAVKVHKNARPFECNSCSETFPRNSDLKQHVEKVHNNI